MKWLTHFNPADLFDIFYIAEFPKFEEKQNLKCEVLSHFHPDDLFMTYFI